MGRIRSRDTQPEMIIRRGLQRQGFRFRLHGKDLVGTPDLVLPKYHAVIFIHGCFWHAHEGCSFFRLPKTRTEYWQDKLSRNVERDKKAVDTLNASGWRVLIVWECATKTTPVEKLINQIADWLQGGAGTVEIAEYGSPA